MIHIEERKTKKLPGDTSLFLSFNYNPNVVEIVKNIDSSRYDKKTKEWEVSVLNTAEVIDRLCVIDDIELQLMKDKKEKDSSQDKLSNYKTKPFSYQIDGIRFGLSHDKWLLLDPPGLGKTLQLIYLAQELKKRHGIEHCLIVCGINTLKMNWKSEIEKHSKMSAMILGQRVNKKGKIVIDGVQKRLQQLKSKISEFFVITNIETLRNSDIVNEINKGKHNKFDMIVVDEIHTTKNPTSAQGANLLKLNKAKFRIGATGTLMMNDPLDTYVPMKWIGADRADYTSFKRYYCKYGGQFNKDIVGYKNLDTLKSQLEMHTLRRPKDILGLPTKTIINEYVEMNNDQALFYSDIKDGIVAQVDKVKLSTSNVLAMIARLRQATVLPSILTTSPVKSSKIERAKDLAEQIVSNGDKVVIFSTFKQPVYELERELKQYGVVVGTGDIKDADIEEAKHQFQNDDNIRVFIGTWSKCGTGITLTKASYMIFLDTPWTNSAYEQAQDRIYRIGTTNSVFIYNLIANDTVDERVLEIVTDKKYLSDYVIDGEITQQGLESLRKYIYELCELS